MVEHGLLVGVQLDLDDLLDAAGADQADPEVWGPGIRARRAAAPTEPETGEQAEAVPKQVIAFLNDPANRALLRGVITAGNTNFGEHFCLAAQKIAVKCDAPLLYRFELMGTEQDVANVNEGLMKLWQ